MTTITPIAAAELGLTVGELQLTDEQLANVTGGRGCREERDWDDRCGNDDDDEGRGRRRHGWCGHERHEHESSWSRDFDDVRLRVL